MVNGQVENIQTSDKILGKTCYGTGHYALIEDFYDCIKTGRKFSIDAKEASKVIKLIKLILKIYKENKL